MTIERKEGCDVFLAVSSDGTISFGRKRSRDQRTKQAIPFAWLRTEEEAENLMILHCFLDNSGYYRVKPTWASQDIQAAIRECRRIFGLKEPS